MGGTGSKSTTTTNITLETSILAQKNIASLAKLHAKYSKMQQSARVQKYKLEKKLSAVEKNNIMYLSASQKILTRQEEMQAMTNATRLEQLQSRQPGV